MEEITSKIHDLVEQLPENIEYNISIGMYNFHKGKLLYLLTAIGETLARMCNNIDKKNTKTEGDPIAPLIVLQVGICQIIGSSILEVMKKYGAKMPEKPEIEFNEEEAANA